MLTLGFVATVLLAFAARAFADDAADCHGDDPQKGVAACTRIIDQPGASAPALAAALADRGKHYVGLDDADHALAD